MTQPYTIASAMNRTPGIKRIAVGIATRGRPAILLETLRELDRQTRPADRIIVSYVTDADIAGARELTDVEFLVSVAGLPHQRNTILDSVGDDDFVLFLDDDFLPAPRYIEATLMAFDAAKGVVVTTGRVLADGARGPGLSVTAGRYILARHRDDAAESGTIPTFNGYGCNMALRLDIVRAQALRFDERLPLYAWYEDIDMCRRLGLHGQVVEVLAACGVHLGAKQGRTAGRRLGYSQVINPLYLWRKGSYPLSRALRSVAAHLLINGVRVLRPEPWIDRRGRLIGNGLAVLDILRGRAKPERVLDL
jgi:GT2 family glycosyltransferase